ncbi:MAG: electron transfer flavoprotein subunit beta/FixA family protein [Synergistaceae bacterium]|jgi:electron transfer flavoprotein beta subunit|nr:electron transfer flavoprotein subunit beta/FixA family protein [Synergistaceae bacterium]
MRIAVLIKQVPDTDDVKMDPERGTMIREGAGGVVNPLDLNALEAAMRIRLAGDSVTLLSMGPPNAEEALREGLSFGADRAILATDRAFAGSDSWATSKVLAAMLEKIGVPDLIIAGEKATDGETGQVGPEVAALLGVPVETRVTRLEKSGDGIEVDCTLEDGILTQRVQLPCVVTVLSDINIPSLPTLAGKKSAYLKDVETLTAESLGFGPDEVGLDVSPTRVVRIDRPEIARTAEKFFAKHEEELEAGLNRVVEILSNCGVLRGAPE